VAEDPLPIPFTLIPQTDVPLSPQDELANAVADALDVPQAEPQRIVEPYGRSWMLADQRSGGFVRRGGDVVVVEGKEALKAWCIMAVHTERYAHPIFSDQFGVEGIAATIGQFPTPGVANRVGDAIIRALLRHDRIAAVEDMDVDYDPDAGEILIRSFTVVTDDEDRLFFGDIRLDPVRAT
jgi:hypothetical protein